MEGPCPEPPLPAQIHPNQPRGLWGALIDGCMLEVLGLQAPGRPAHPYLMGINIRCHLHPDECCHVQLPQLLRQGIPEGQSQWSQILPSPSHRHPAPI